MAHDRFDLSDRTGQKLNATLQEAIRSGVVCGSSGPRRLRVAIAEVRRDI
jgi:hypothetical protein